MRLLKKRGPSPPDFGVGAELARMLDAGEKEKVLETVSELLTSALRQATTLAARVAELQRQLYGQKKERISPHQLALALAELRQEQVDKAESTGAPDAPVAPVLPSEAVPRLRQATRRGRQPLPAHLPRIEIPLPPTPEQLAATSSGMRKMGEERSEVLELVPAGFRCTSARCGPMMLARSSPLPSRQMYAVEAASREANESHQARLVRRQRDTTPILDELRTWLDEHMGSEPPSSPLGKAIAYVDNKWAVLRCFLYDGALEIDNGDAERALRGTAMRGSLCITPSSTWKPKGSLVRRIATRATTTMGACA